MTAPQLPLHLWEVFGRKGLKDTHDLPARPLWKRRDKQMYVIRRQLHRQYPKLVLMRNFVEEFLRCVSIELRRRDLRYFGI